MDNVRVSEEVLAREAASHGDWSKSLTHWERAREQGASEIATTIGIALALRRLGRYEDAESALLSELSRHPNSSHLSVEYGWTACDRKNYAQALQRFHRTRSTFPNEPTVDFGYAYCLMRMEQVSEAERVLELHLSRTESPRWGNLYARCAEQRLDWAEAVNRWISTYCKFPDDATGYRGALAAARKAALPSVAEEILSAAAERATGRGPGWSDLLSEYAEAAASAGNWAEALRRWSDYRTNFPDNESGYLGASNALRMLVKNDEANQLLGDAVKRFPGSLNVAVAYARLAMRSGDWQSALNRWSSVKSQFATEVAFVGYVSSLRSLRRFNEANEAARSALLQYPDSQNINVEYACIARDERIWKSAYERWKVVIFKFPSLAAGYVGAAAALRELGEYVPAEAMFKDAMSRFPNEPSIWGEHAQLAASQGRWQETLVRLQRAKELFPLNHDISTRLGEALQLAALAKVEPSVSVESDAVNCEPVSEQPPPASVAANFFMKFESLGDNCEFGLVQRHFGAEPLGLLRWTAIKPQSLVEGLRQKFNGLSDSDNVMLSTRPGEYYLTDKKYEMYMHTFIKSDMDQTKLHLQMCKRLKFLARKLLDDLASSDKIFVYKTRDGCIADEEINKISDELSQFGAVKFLCVRRVRDGAQNAEVRLISNYTAIGYIDRLSISAAHAEIDYESWEKICVAAYKLLN